MAVGMFVKIDTGEDQLTEDITLNFPRLRPVREKQF